MQNLGEVTSLHGLQRDPVTHLSKSFPFLIAQVLLQMTLLLGGL